MTYEYLCGACGHEWEVEQSIRDNPLKKCPQCGKLRAQRQVSGGTGFLLKGGGWYADGYGSSNAGKGSDKSDKSDKSEAKSESTDTGSKDGAKSSKKKADKGGKTAA